MAPRPPKSVTLGKSGSAFWRWAWKTPQAAAWDDGAVPFVARRAQLEDDLAALEVVDLGPIPLEETERDEWLRSVGALVGVLQRLARGSLGVMKEIRELDDRLGLNPKAMAQLRWTIVPEATAAETASPSVTNLSDRRGRLSDAS